MAWPSIAPGAGTLSIPSTVGAMSKMLGFVSEVGRLERNIPEVSLGSEAQ